MKVLGEPMSTQGHREAPKEFMAIYLGKLL